jgi:hypothetical protein
MQRARHRGQVRWLGDESPCRKHTVHVFRDLPDLIYPMLSKVSSMRSRVDGEIAAMRVRELPPAHAHHLMVEAVKAAVVPGSRLPKVIEAWELRHAFGAAPTPRCAEGERDLDSRVRRARKRVALNVKPYWLRCACQCRTVAFV